MQVPAPWPRSWGTHPHWSTAAEAPRPACRREWLEPSDTTGTWRNPARSRSWRVAQPCASAISAKMTQAVASKAFPAPGHDHDLCLEEAMERAREAFQNKGLKLTPLRQSVFREIAASHKAIG